MGISIIDPDMGTGYDFQTLSDWEAWLDNSAMTEAETAQCRCTGGTADTGIITISGVTGNSDTNYIKIVVEDGYRHQGFFPPSGNYYRIKQTSSSVAMRIDEGYVHIDGVPFEYGHNTTDRDIFETVSTTSTGWIKIENCIAANDADGIADRAYDLAFAAGLSNQTYYVINCQSIGMVSVGCGYLGGGDGGTTNKTIVYNNLAYGGCASYGFRTYTASYLFKNNICQDITGVEYSVGSGSDLGSSTNITDGTQPAWASSGEVAFENEGPNSSYDLRLSASDTVAVANGLDLRTDSDGYFSFNYDCAGNKRGSTWDIGPYQITPAGNFYHLMI